MGSAQRQVNQEALQAAVRLHQAGDLPRAEAAYRQILAADPNHPDALHYLGLLAHQVGQHGPAWELMRRAIALSPSSAHFYCNAAPVVSALGNADQAIQLSRQALALRPEYPEAFNNLASALRTAGQWDEAIASCRRAIALRPGFPEAHHNLGVALTQKGLVDEAVAALRTALSQRPDYVEALTALGAALNHNGEADEAIACFRKALSLNPDSADALDKLAGALQERGEFDEAIACGRRATALRPESAAAQNNLGVALKNSGRVDEAILSLKRAAELEASSAEIHNNLGVAYREKGRLDDAIASFRRAVELRPDDVETLSNLGTGLKDAGLIAESVECYRRAVEFKADSRVASNLVYALHFDASCTPRQLWAEQVRWYETYAKPLEGAIGVRESDRTPDRRLRVGYVSPDWRDHPIGRFMLPLLTQHDRSQFEVFCYSDVTRPDAITAQLREHTDAWRDTVALSDEKLARLIRDDRIDILVDLTMHMAGTRLLTFARKPAPVQVTYLAYCGTTGLRTIDYRLTDLYLDPAGADGSLYSERSVRIPSYWCYQSPENAPEVRPVSARSAGQVTFGCLNNFCKVSPDCLATWCRLLREVPGSRLLLHANEGSHRQRVHETVEREGIEASRVDFVGHLPLAQYLEQYHRIEVALDPFPYPGGTTSCDALWMGVPVVTLPHSTALSRGGVSILSHLGLAELIAPTTADYVRIAADLARDLPRLGQLRSTLRDRMRSSPLMDAPAFARSVESAYRQMWREWSAGGL